MVLRLLLSCLLPPLLWLPVCAQTWQPLLPSKDCGADSSIYSLALDNAGRVLIAGEDGLAYISMDRSDTFTPLRIGPAIDLYDAGFPSPSALALCGDSGVILRSNDNGVTWVRNKLAGFEARAHYSMCWLDSATVLLGGGSRTVAHGSAAVPDGFILRSVDGGNTWMNVFSDAASFVWALTTEGQGSTQRCYAGVYSPLSGGRILVSTDAGARWTVAVNNLPFLPHDISTDFGDGKIIAVGGNPFSLSGNPRIAWMDVAGVWTVLPDTLPSTGFAWSAGAVSGLIRGASRVFVGTQSGAVLVSDSSGVAWHVDGGSDKIHCPVYAMAARRFEGAASTDLILAAGSGRGLFRRYSEPSSNGTLGSARSPRIELDVFPNPVYTGNASAAVLHVRGRDTAPLFLSVHDILGRIVARLDCGVSAGEFQRVEAVLQGLPSGVYVLHAVNGIRTGRVNLTIVAARP